MNALAASYLAYISHYRAEADILESAERGERRFAGPGPVRATAIVACLPAFTDPSGQSSGARRSLLCPHCCHCTSILWPDTAAEHALIHALFWVATSPIVAVVCSTFSIRSESVMLPAACPSHASPSKKVTAASITACRWRFAADKGCQHDDRQACGPGRAAA